MHIQSKGDRYGVTLKIVSLLIDEYLAHTSTTLKTMISRNQRPSHEHTAKRKSKIGQQADSGDFAQMFFFANRCFDIYWSKKAKASAIDTVSMLATSRRIRPLRRDSKGRPCS